MAFNVRQMPADQAAALIGEDDVAVFSPACGIMAATSQFDLEEPDSTRLTLLFEVDEDDLYREGKWLDGIDYMSDLVFETPSGLIGKASKLFGTFIGDGHATLSEDLIETRYLFAKSGGTCSVFSGSSERKAVDAKKRTGFKPNGGNEASDGRKRLATANECPADLARLAAESRERSRSLTDPGTQARGAKRAAGSSAQDGAAGRGPAL